jgi:nitric-oxide synthase, bacterial
MAHSGCAAACPVGDDRGRRPTLVAPRLPVAVHRNAPGVDLAEAEEFFDLYRAQARMPELDCRRRLDEMHRQIDETGTYVHTPDELAVGARLAWRNHTRCIGKLYWRSLLVRDHRRLTSASGIRDALLAHLRCAGNGGQIRPVISVFAPDGPDGPGPRLRNRQLVSYAGHRLPDGTVVGDPAGAELTRLARQRGWSPAEPGPFDLLPLLIETADGQVTAHELPSELAFEVPIRHPRAPGLAELGLRWYGFPTVSDMSLLIGGLRYPLAPFTGWYVAPEVSARDLTDPHRYNLLPAVAGALGLDTSTARSLWRDRALIELTDAVLWSYEQAGIRIDDHHTAAERFHRYTLTERRRGREVEADWAWMISPLSASATPVFHERYSNRELRPNFVRADPATPDERR